MFRCRHCTVDLMSLNQLLEKKYIQTEVCGNGARKKAVWGLKVENTYHGGDRTEGGGLTHSPHYHLPHYAESDPLVGHTGGDGRGSSKCYGTLESHRRGDQRKIEGRKAVWVHRKHTGAQHTKHKSNEASIKMRGKMMLKNKSLQKSTESYNVKI